MALAAPPAPAAALAPAAAFALALAVAPAPALAHTCSRWALASASAFALALCPNSNEVLQVGDDSAKCFIIRGVQGYPTVAVGLDAKGVCLVNVVSDYWYVSTSLCFFAC